MQPTAYLTDSSLLKEPAPTWMPTTLAQDDGCWRAFLAELQRCLSAMQGSIDRGRG